MAVEVPVRNYLKSKCVYCGYGCYLIYKKIPNLNALEIQEIVICERQTKECSFTPFIYIPPNLDGAYPRH
jgi:hypothetical protein